MSEPLPEILIQVGWKPADSTALYRMDGRPPGVMDEDGAWWPATCEWEPVYAVARDESGHRAVWSAEEVAALEAETQRVWDDYREGTAILRAKVAALEAEVEPLIEARERAAVMEGERRIDALDRTLDVLIEALPRVPWGENDECYSCGSGEGDPHFEGCAWVTARAVLARVRGPETCPTCGLKAVAKRSGTVLATACGDAWHRGPEGRGSE